MQIPFILGIFAKYLRRYCFLSLRKLNFQCHSYPVLKRFLRIMIPVNSDSLLINFMCLFYYTNKLGGTLYFSHSSATQSVENKPIIAIAD